MEPKIVTKEAFTVVGVTAAGQPGELNYGEIWNNQYMPLDERIKPYSIDGGYYGASFCDGTQTVYLAGMGVAGLMEIPAGAEARDIPAAQYAVFACSMDAIGPTWHTAYEEWLPTSNYELDSGKPDFEYYPPENSASEQRVEIYIPVKVKETDRI